MKLAFVYAGQGSQFVGMGQDFYESCADFKQIFDSAALDFDLKDLCFNGSEAQLAQTAYTQPCMVAFAAGVTRLLYNAGITPEMVAGLSLGEYAALHAAGVLDAKTAISLAAFRGKAMEAAVKDLPCGMTAILGLAREKVEEACLRAQDLGVVSVANYNCPGQLVIAGVRAAVDKASELALAMGAKRAIPLKVSGAFHTALMAPAADALAEKFKTIHFGEMQIPVIFNSTAKPLAPDTTIADMLIKQVQSSVYFEDTIRYFEAQGIDTVIEIGPGKTLCGFIRKTGKSIKAYAVQDIDSLNAAIAAVKGEQSYVTQG